MIDILYGLAELAAILLGMLLQLALALPSPVLGGLIAVLFLMAAYRQGWNNAVEADYIGDIQKAQDRRRARRR